MQNDIRKHENTSILFEKWFFFEYTYVHKRLYYLSK